MISDVIPFGEWMPDQAPFMNMGVIEARNVFPDGNDYKPFKTLVGNIPALPSACRGAFSFLTDQGVSETFAGTATKLYRLVNRVWIDVTRATGGNYNVPADGMWIFKNYGNRVIATNYTDDMQTMLLGTDTKFIRLKGGSSAGTPPKARYMAILNNQVVVANLVHPDDNVKGQRVEWSGLDDPLYWADSTTVPAVNIQKQADFQDLYGDYGLISGIVNLKDYLVVVMNSALIRMTATGAPAFYSFETVEFKKGSRCPASIVTSGQTVYFLADDGFYAFDGTDAVPIGDKRVDKFFYADVSPNALYKTQGVVDPKNKFVAWMYQSSNSANGIFDRMLIYSWVDNKWTHADVSAQYVFNGLSASTTLEALGATYPNIETVPYSFDSSVWVGGNNLLSGFTSTGSLGLFEGPLAPATIETTESRFNSDGMAIVLSVLPIVDTENCTVSIGSRKGIAATVNYTADVNTNDETGEADVFTENRYHRGRIKIPTGTVWTKAQGVRFRVQAGGGI